MLNYIGQVHKDFWHWVWALNYQDWFMGFVLTVIVGYFLLKGFGSRKDY